MGPFNKAHFSAEMAFFYASLLSLAFCSLANLPLATTIACGRSEAAESIPKDEKAWLPEVWEFHVRCSLNKPLLSTVAMALFGSHHLS